jgi:putative membrane protein
MWNFIAVWIVTAVSLLIIARLPIGISVRDTGSAFVAALVLGLLNAFLGPILRFLAFPLTVLTLGLFAIVINAFLLWLTDKLVDGFKIDGALSAILGAIILGILNTLIFWVIPG